MNNFLLERRVLRIATQSFRLAGGHTGNGYFLISGKLHLRGRRPRKINIAVPPRVANVLAIQSVKIPSHVKEFAIY
jgi:hypothetical protein